MKYVYMIWGVAFCIMVVVALSTASNIFLGQGLIESVWELVFVSALALVATGPLWAIGIKFRKTFLVYAGLGLGLMMVGVHLRASVALAPLKVQFHSISSRGPIKIDWAVAEDSNGTYSAADFGGSLKALVERREQRLTALGYTGLGGWMYRNGGARTTMVYIYAPWSSVPTPLAAVLAVVALLGYFAFAAILAEWEFEGISERGGPRRCGS